MEVGTAANTERDVIAVVKVVAAVELDGLAVILSHFYIPGTVWEFLSPVL